jgi:Ca2+-binding EF-hand superfamily protein
MKYQIVLLCSAALFSTAAMSGEEKSKEGGNATFEALDTDADGRISKSEVAGTSLSGDFTKLDSDSDGYVSKKEFRSNTMPKKESPTRPY